MILTKYKILIKRKEMLLTKYKILIKRKEKVLPIFGNIFTFTKRSFIRNLQSFLLKANFKIAEFQSGLNMRKYISESGNKKVNASPHKKFHFKRSY